MWVGWGPEQTFLYNDAYISVLSLAKHPQALAGLPASEVWAEIWDFCGPLADKVFTKERPSLRFVDDVRLFMNRGGFHWRRLTIQGMQGESPATARGTFENQIRRKWDDSNRRAAQSLDLRKRKELESIALNAHGTSDPARKRLLHPRKQVEPFSSQVPC